MTLDGYPGPENVGILLAKERGYFDDVGLDVSYFSPAGPLRPVRYVANGETDVSISHQPQIALAQEKGAPVVAFGSLIPQPTAAMIWLAKSKISGIADLKGKTIGIPGLSFQRDFLGSVLAEAGLSLTDVKVKTVEYDLVPSLVSGDVDAIFGGSANLEGSQLQARGMKPIIIPVRDLGIPPYEELVLIARPDRLAKDPQSIRDFISAMIRGNAAAIEDPNAAKALLETYLNQRTVKVGVEATLPLLSATGRMSPGKAAPLVDWMFEEGMIKRKLPASALLTNNYVEP
jgi:putative hydroxymethylpyrimidine transport system substrate-binding protein